MIRLTPAEIGNSPQVNAAAQFDLQIEEEEIKAQPRSSGKVNKKDGGDYSELVRLTEQMLSPANTSKLSVIKIKVEN